MKTHVPTMLAIGWFGSGIGMTFAADPYSSNATTGNEVSPTIEEYVKPDTITGTLMRKAGEYYFIENTDGGIERIHVDHSTKLDKVEAGDMVKAYVTEQDHTTALQRVNLSQFVIR